MKFISHIAIILLICLNGNNALAQTHWSDLKASQQKILLPFESSWNELNEQARVKLINNTNKWLEMTPKQRRESKNRLNRFKELSIEDQKKLKRRIERYKNLSPEERKKLDFARKKFQKLDPEERYKLKKRYDRLPLHQRKKAVREFSRKQRDNDFVNNFKINKRPLIREMYKLFTQPERRQLRQHMRDLKPKERHSLVLEFLEMNVSQRSEYVDSLSMN